MRPAHSQIVSKKYNDGKKKMPTYTSKSNMDGKKVALGREESGFFSWAPLGLSAPGGEKPMERVCFLVASRPGLHRQLVKSGLCDGALGLVVTYLKP